MSEIRCPLHEMAQIAPRQPAWMEEGRAVMYPAAHVAAREVCGRLREEFGVGPGDRVVIAAGPQWRWLPLLFGLFRAGAVACPQNMRLPAAGRRERAGELTPVLQVVEDHGELLLPGTPALRMSALCEETMHGARDAGPTLLDLEDPATLLYTTGSMGRAKAVVHSFGAHYYSALGANRHLHLTHRHRWLLSLPLYHVGGLGVVFRCVMAGAAVVRADAEQDVGDAVLEQGVTHVSLVPTQLRRLMGHGRAAELAGQLEVILLGGGPIPRELVGEALDAGFRVHATYGLTETASQVTTVSLHASAKERRESEGVVLPHREVRISEEGEVMVRGPSLALGIWDRGRIEPIVDEEGWLATGDLGEMEEGRLRVRGRRDSVFISGGENIQPEEIERVLLEVTGASRAVVTALPDEEFGYRPLAWLDLPGEVFAPEEWEGALRKALPGYMLPVEYRALPAAGGLKPDRAALTRMGASELGG